MPSVKRLHQAFILIPSQESQALTFNDLVDPSNANLLVIDPTFTIEKENFDRTNVNRPSVSPLQPLAGITTGSASFGVELSTTTGTNEPGWSTVMQACGMRVDTMWAQEIDSTLTPKTGYEAIGAGERIVQAGSGAKGYLVHTVRAGTTPDLHAYIRLDEGSETPDGTTAWTSDDSDGLFTATSLAKDVGYCWTPASFGTQWIVGTLATTAFTVGEIVTDGTTSAIGVVVEALPTGAGTMKIRRLNGEFAGSGGTYTGSALPTPGVFTSSASWSQHECVAVNLGLIEDSRIKRGEGWRGSWAFSAELGGAGRLDFSMKGLVSSTEDAGAIAGTTYTAEVPPVLLNQTFIAGKDTEDLDAVASPRLQSIAFDHGTEVDMPRDASEPTGVYDGAFIVGRSSTGSLNLTVEPESVYGWLERMRNGDPIAILQELVSPNDANKVIRVEAPGALLVSESGGDQNGFATTDFSLQLGSRGVAGADIVDAELILSYQHSVLP